MMNIVKKAYVFQWEGMLEQASNMMVINLPPDKNGKLVDSDVENLMLVAEKLQIRR